jgi:hypothetical protein
MTDWMDELYKMHQEDKGKQNSKKVDPLDLSVLSKNRIELAAATLRSVNAMAVMRRVQSALLGGKGAIDTFDNESDYDRVIILCWQGVLSAARKPDPGEPFWYISAGACGKKLYVNGKEVTPITPEAFKKAIVQAAKKPGKSNNGENSKQ